MAPSAASDPELEKMLILLSPQLSLPMTVLIKTGVSVAQLYVLAALMHFTYGFISGRKTEFSLVFQVAAYAAAPALLCVVPFIVPDILKGVGAFLLAAALKSRLR